MTDIRPWLAAVESLGPVEPANSGELVEVLGQVAALAGQWSDILDGLRNATRRFGGPAAAASLEVACRRSEQAFVELEIALRDARGGLGAR